MPSRSCGPRATAALLFALPLIVWSSVASACPLGPNESRLDLSRVMRNFGRFLLPADQIARSGAQRPPSATDQQIATAIEGIQVAHSCARAVLESKNDDLLPAKAGRLQGEEREQYVQKFRLHMEEFASALDEFKTLFVTLLRTEKERRDFRVLETKRNDVRERANKAHADL